MFKKAILDSIRSLDTSKVTIKFLKTKKLCYGLYPFKLRYTFPYLSSFLNSMEPIWVTDFNSARNAYYDDFQIVLERITAIINDVNNFKWHKKAQNCKIEITIPDDLDHLDYLVALNKKIVRLEAENRSLINIKYIPNKSPNTEYNTRVILSLNQYISEDGKKDVDDFISYMTDVYGDCVVFNPKQIGYSNSRYYRYNQDFKLYIYIPDLDDGLMFIPHLNHKFVTGIKTEVFLNE